MCTLERGGTNQVYLFKYELFGALSPYANRPTGETHVLIAFRVDCLPVCSDVAPLLLGTQIRSPASPSAKTQQKPSLTSVLVLWLFLLWSLHWPTTGQRCVTIILITVNRCD